MPEIIFDTSVLSNFALSDSLSVIEKLYAGHSYITEFVAAENMRGIASNHRKLITIKKALMSGWLTEVTLEGKEEKSLFESLSLSLGLGEASSIAVAKVRGFVFASDDRAARREANLLGVKLTGTIGILIKAVKKKVVKHKEADRILGVIKTNQCRLLCPVRRLPHQAVHLHLRE
jgi:predicted nucleic acid-binding protein